jgi:CBS domain-containing membrane protein
MNTDSMENSTGACRIDISDDDVLDAMKEIPGYLDITPGDFKEVYRFACQHALNRLTRTVMAHEIMTRDVVSVGLDTKLSDVASTMAAHGISGVPVLTGEGTVAGVISEKDFLAVLGAGEFRNFMGIVAECLASKGCLVAPVRAKLARDVMSSPPVTVRADTRVVEIMDLFARRKINRVPVTDPEGHLLGIVSRADVMRTPFVGEGK